jgi:DNA polymerase (family 10)
MKRELGDSLALLQGVELNIGPAGELDYDLEFRKGFDFCIASVHDHFDLDRAAQTARIVKAMHDPCVRMIGHLTARMIGARPPIEVDLDAILSAAEQTGTALEVNGGLPRLDMSVEQLRRARERDVTFVLTSDAHQTSELDRVRYAALNAERAWVEPGRIANAWPGDRLVAWTQSKRGAA